MLHLIEYPELVQHYAHFFKDVFSRSIRGWNLSNSLDKSLTMDALLQGLEDYVPEIHHSDNVSNLRLSSMLLLCEPAECRSVWPPKVSPGRRLC